MSLREKGTSYRRGKGVFLDPTEIRSSRGDPDVGAVNSHGKRYFYSGGIT